MSEVKVKREIEYSYQWTAKGTRIYKGVRLIAHVYGSNGGVDTAKIICQLLAERDKNQFSSPQEVTDEEIEKELTNHYVSGEPKNEKLYREGIRFGAKWMRSKFTGNQNL